MTAATVSSSRVVPISVAISALFSIDSPEHAHRAPFRKAPRPRTAVYVSLRIGLCTTPTTGRLSTTSAMDTQEKGNP